MSELHNVDAERLVLGAMMLSPAAVGDVREHISAADLYEPRHATIYSAILAAVECGEPAEAVAIGARLDASGDLSRIGGLPYLHTVYKDAPLPAQAGFYAREIARLAKRRRGRQHGAYIMQVAESDDIDRLTATLDLGSGVLLGSTASRAGGGAFAKTLLRRSELTAMPPVEPLIEGVLSLNTAAVLFGPTGAGKTFLALGWACSVATGTPWLGHQVRRCRVMYVVGEGASGLDKRVAAWEYAWHVKVTDDDVVFSVKPDSLSDMNVWVQMRTEALALGVKFVVLDTFSSLAPDADETRDAPTFTRRLSDLAAAIGGTALAVHHPGWSDSERTRGGYQLEANVDEVIRLSGSAQSDLVELTRKKVKEGQSGERLWLRRRFIELGIDDDGKPYGSLIVQAASSADRQSQALDAAEAVVRELFATGGASAAQIRDALQERLEVSRTSAYAHLQKLVAADVLRPSGGTEARPRYEVV